MKTDYNDIDRKIKLVIEDVPHFTANLANITAVIKMTMKDINWVGFYLVDDDTLILGPFQGKPACTEIPNGRGVCGTALWDECSQLVGDVYNFPGHIACDPDSRSEVAVPIFKDGKVVGVLDVDSPKLRRFTKEDLVGLEMIVRTIEKYVFEEDA